MTNKKTTLISYCILTLLLFSTIAFAQVKETFESAIKNGMFKGIIKRDGYKIIYIAAPATDTTAIRNYYEELINKSGKPYLFSFESNAIVQPPKIKNTNSNDGIRLERPNENQGISLPPNAATIPAATTPAGYFTKQIVFGELHYTDRTGEHTFEIPAGVTTIKIEAWSGGGNGNIKEFFSYRLRTQDLNVRGGGGGGGGYANTIIDVKKGDKILITIPSGGGGKSLKIRLNNNDNIFYLNNGTDATTDSLYEGGYGGNSGGVYGIFKQKLYWLAGENGEALQINLTRSLDNNLWAYRHFGKGGSAALLNNGGREGKDFFVFTPNAISKASNGGFPGGGGGGGNLDKAPQVDFLPNERLTLLGATKGAPGMVVIHY